MKHVRCCHKLYEGIVGECFSCQSTGGQLSINSKQARGGEREVRVASVELLK